MHERNKQTEQGEIKFHETQMKYKPFLPPAINGLNLEIPAATKLAVVGRTGAGKSSLYQLLLGFRSADRGTLAIDGQDVSLINLNSLRDEINVVLQ